MASNVIEERELRNTLRRLVRRQVVYGEKQTRKRGDFLDGPGVSASNAGGTIPSSGWETKLSCGNY